MVRYIYHGEYTNYDPKERRFICPKCGLDFASDNYKSYFNQVDGLHWAERPCPECGKKCRNGLTEEALGARMRNAIRNCIKESVQKRVARPLADEEAAKINEIFDRALKDEMKRLKGMESKDEVSGP